MSRKLLRSPFFALVVALGLAACSDSATEPTAATAPEAPLANRPAPQNSTAKYEIRYMEFTIDHHAMGVMMAQLCIQKAVHEELRQLCQTSLENQQRQIQQLQTWLRDWYGIAYEPELKPGDMRMMEKLAELSGAEFEIEFMETFSKHHERIIKESEKAVQRVFHEELRQLAANIIQSQSQQVAQMRSWLCIWYSVCRSIV